MQIIQAPVTTLEIETSIRAARFEGHDPARWALPLVAAADERCGGRWSLVALAPELARALWLPAHAGEACHGDTAALAGGEGGTLDCCAGWLAAHAESYARRNPSCWSRITSAQAGTWGPLIIAPFDVGDRVGPGRGALVVVDGLHRALGWALRAQQQPLRAYLAGPAVSGSA
jgi:hypothetical protein